MLAVPLRSAAEVVDEACAMRNCADTLIDDCAAGSTALISFRHAKTGKRQALARYNLADNVWFCTEVKASCNRAAQPPAKAAATRAADILNNWVKERYD